MDIKPSGAALVKDSIAHRASWYGSWRGKSKPVAEVANVSAGQSPPQEERPATPRRRKTPQKNPPGSPYATVRHAPSQASVTKLSVTSNGMENFFDSKNPKPPQEDVQMQDAPASDVPAPDTNQKPEPEPAPAEQTNAAQPKPDPSSGWFGWWSRPDGYQDKTGPKEPPADKPAVAEPPLQDPPAVPPSVAEPPKPVEAPAAQTDYKEATSRPASAMSAKPSELTQDSKETAARNRSSWFWGWSSAQNAQPEPSASAAESSAEQTQAPQDPQQTAPAVPASDIQHAPSVTEPTASSQAASKPQPPKGPQRQKSTGWVFWSKSQPSETDPNKQVGELAVADTPSASHPEAAQFNEGEEAPKTTPKEASKPVKAAPLALKPSKKDAKREPLETPKPGTQIQRNPNLVLPEFHKTYTLAQPASLWQIARRYVLGQDPELSHLHINPNPPRIKKAIAMGVHGFFPAPIIQKVIGQPTGTSIRFANSAATAIQKWTEEQGYECEIEKVALEGEGFIADRVDLLWKLMLNWIEHIRKADFILVACHSQGVPVATMLVAKLIQFGCVNNAKIGICAMAGVNLGPFAEYKTRMFGGSALELFDFADPSSRVSGMYRTALDQVVNHGVRVVYIGSIDDQLVSLESSTFSNVSHPYIYRAAFIDGRLHAADFIAHLVAFSLKLRNLGLSDHGLIRELSPALAGSLYTGEGHSRLYDSPNVYSLAISHALETTSLPHSVPLVVKPYEGPPSTKDANPYFLPWAMRGVLEEERVRNELMGDCQDLLALFEEWRPQSKGLKDIKFRLEALRSKL
ncbi:hypothetical protein EJ06DRAFT_481470 [Trichodelitschia bisporula]|uniref:YMC020W-like alpha/beta hydrolase domain-containing protein n=1 Tax=Trichodelitschia bisporula TaxID=703511 RepID=A0A6G1HP92_9PEZI|nr:hypothetical protein EJ06DRAFT_481470 [Trichodelitschia bisporula]